MSGPRSVPDTTAAPLVRSIARMLPDLQATEDLGRAIGASLGAGDVVVLSGELGAGKTALTKAIARGMGITETITSPTFVLSHVHHGPGTTLVHVDAYRLGGALELEDLDLDGDVTRAAVVVEWGAGLAEQFAQYPLAVELVRRPDDVRDVVLAGDPARWMELFAALS